MRLSRWYVSGPLPDDVLGVVVVSCCMIARCASTCPNSPSGLLALRPDVGSDVTLGTGGAG